MPHYISLHFFKQNRKKVVGRVVGVGGDFVNVFDIHMDTMLIIIKVIVVVVVCSSELCDYIMLVVL